MHVSNSRFIVSAIHEKIGVADHIDVAARYEARNSFSRLDNAISDELLHASEAEAARRLNYHLAALAEELHALDKRRVLHVYDTVHMLAHDWEVVHTNVWKSCAFSDRFLTWLVDNFSRQNGLFGVVASLRLYSVHTTLRVDSLHCETDAADEATTANAYDDVVQVGYIFKNFFSGGTLTSYHVEVVKRRDESSARFDLPLLDERVDVLLEAVNEDDFSAVASSGVDFERR